MNDWKHLSEKLKEHDNSVEDITNMNIWNETRVRLRKNKGIDKDLQERMQRKEHWRQVLIIIIIIYLVNNNNNNNNNIRC